MAICLATSVGAVALVANSFTLAWTHSIERQRWEEDWSVRAGASGAELVLEHVRVRGHGAGMEPPPGAQLHDGVWEWHPRQAHAALRLTRSGYTADYDWCTADGACRTLASILPSDGGVTEVRPCSMAGKEEGAGLPP